MKFGAVPTISQRNDQILDSKTERLGCLYNIAPVICSVADMEGVSQNDYSIIWESKSPKIEEGKFQICVVASTIFVLKCA